MSNYCKNERRSNGEEAAVSFSFSERGIRGAIFHLTANMCGVKVDIVTMSKRKRKERNYLFHTVEFISGKKTLH